MNAFLGAGAADASPALLDESFDEGLQRELAVEDKIQEYR
jgi:hypothetical protein